MTPQIVELSEVGSTNDWMADHAQDALWVRADRQTAGRGRRARPWRSEAGNLFASTFVEKHPDEGPLPQLSFVAANALFETATRSIAGSIENRRLSLKWPNDLLMDGCKLAGILLEGHAKGVVIGFGVNLAHHPDDIARPATSLAAAGVAVPDAQAFCIMLAAAFSAHRLRWRRDGFATTRSDWLAVASGRSGPAVARLGNEDVHGVFEDLADDGALLLRLPNGAIRPIHAGEVFMTGGNS